MSHRDEFKPCKRVPLDSGYRIKFLSVLSDKMEVVAIDPGISHCGMVRRVGDSYVECGTHDLTRYRAKQLADRVRSFVHRHQSILQTADAVVMEIQPPGGGGDVVAQLMYQELREKVVWVHPCALHKHFQLKGLDYDARKRRSIELATSDLSSLNGWTRGRQHDMSDAWMMAEMHCSQLKAAEKLDNLRFECKTSGFDRFRFRSAVKGG